MIELIAKISCPECGYVASEVMPTDQCLFFYSCQGCQQVLRPKLNDCCVFCSYGDRPCPIVQRENNCCDNSK